MRTLPLLLGWLTLNALGCSGDPNASDTDPSSATDTDTDIDTEPDTNVADDGPLEGDLIAYAPGAGHRFRDVHRLSDGTFLVAGSAENLDFLPDGVERVALAGFEGVNSAGSGRVGFLLHLSRDLGRVLRIAHVPSDKLQNLQVIRTTEIPGEATGVLYISGARQVSGWQEDGYVIARLNGNFVDEVPTAAEWTYDVKAEPRQAGGRTGISAYKAIQPWDVDRDGRVIYGRGAEYDFSWASVHALDASGAQAIVPGWPVHWTTDGECHHRRAEDCEQSVQHSGIVLKAGRKGSLRSHSQEAYDARLPDGNGRTDRQGTWPDDVFFSGPCLDDCAGGPGYTGYRTSDKPTQRLGALRIDRRTGRMYLGLSTQSRLPGGNPDFEPSVVAFEADGSLAWWRRLYEENASNSTPDQYVDGLAIDPDTSELVVLARCHGNNTVNLWRGNAIAAAPDASGFQNQFTGTNGNIHISWLGRFDPEGSLQASTYVAEYANSTGGLGEPLADTNLDGWPSPNGGWPNVNTTRCSDVAIGRDGQVLVSCTGRRTITTANAHQRMLPFDDGTSKWNEFVRVYGRDLSTVTYSTLVTGTWDPEAGPQRGNTRVAAVWPVASGAVAVGWHLADEGVARDNAVPTTGVPEWGADQPGGESALFLHVEVE